VSETTRLETIAAANGIAVDENFRAVTPPLYLSSTFTYSGYGRGGPHEYTRTSNPTRSLLAETLAKLEGGAGAVVVSSGMAAVDLVLSQLSRDDLVIAPHDCYGGTYRLLMSRRDRGHFGVVFVDQSNEATLAEALKNGPKLVLIETPSNPLMRIVDIRATVTQAKAAGAKVAVDNTFLSPALQRPITLGADFVIHSTTKYLNGHSDVVGGAVIAAAAADAEALAAWANIVGTSAAFVPCFHAWSASNGRRRSLRSFWSDIRAWPRAIIRACPRIPAMPSPSRSSPALARCSASNCAAGARPPPASSKRCGFSGSRNRSAESRAWCLIP
jgi:cystathionine gamma-synthase